MAIPGNFLSPTAESMDPSYAGWRPRSNAALSIGTGGRNGPNCMVMKPGAAGEMQAETVAGYPVVAGGTYQVFADASASTQPERIGIEWLDATYTPVGPVTWSLTTSAASAAWHRVGVAGVAPVGADRARVVLSSAATAVGVTHFWENVYFGLPIRTPSNLFSFNVESGAEVDTSGWQAETNTTISRTVPPVQWAATYYGAGGHVLTLTAIASGTASAVTAERAAVAQGQEYLAQALVNPPAASANCWVELRFYDPSGGQLQAIRSPLAAPGTGWYRQIVSAIAPAGAATCGLAVGITSASAGQVVRTEAAVALAFPGLHTGTVIPYDAASFEQGPAGWTVMSGGASLDRSTPWGTGFSGSYSLAVSSAAAGVSVLRSPRFPAGAAAGLSWRQEFDTLVTAGAWTMTRATRWYDAAGADLGADVSTEVGLGTSGWWQYRVDAVAPPGAAQAAIEITLTALAGGSALRLDEVSLWQALPLNAVAADDARAAAVLTFRELTAGTLITISRIGADGLRTPVRGPSGLYVQTPVTGDTLRVEDYEAPLNAPVSYRADVYAADGTPQVERTTDTVMLASGDPDLAWLKDPGRPQRNLRLTVRTAPAWTRPVDQSAHRVKGRRNAVVVSDVRGGLEGDLAVWTRNDNERAALHRILDSGSVLLLQVAPGNGLDDMYVSVGEVQEARAATNAVDEWRGWTLPLTQVDMPTAVGVDGTSGRTWQDVLAEVATWQGIVDAYATWEDVLLNRKMGG
ncbi:hypothetical protein [Streptomyces sp. x-80]|uniref:hypothetical protein n=1 Tax=Streptomyces sp. x-80 TaxID=2789282 RepID=UPI0039807004